jgi:hypothetical protein
MEAAMDFKEWFEPRVLISGVVGLALASLIGWLSLAKSLESVPCQPSSGTLWIDLSSSPASFSTVVCAKQFIAWKDNKQVTVKFPDKKCVDPKNYPLNPCAGGYCSQPTQVKQPGSTFSPQYGTCDYKVVDGLTDPRVIIIGK